MSKCSMYSLIATVLAFLGLIIFYFIKKPDFVKEADSTGTMVLSIRLSLIYGLLFSSVIGIIVLGISSAMIDCGIEKCCVYSMISSAIVLVMSMTYFYFKKPEYVMTVPADGSDKVFSVRLSLVYSLLVSSAVALIVLTGFSLIGTTDSKSPIKPTVEMASIGSVKNSFKYKCGGGCSN